MYRNFDNITFWGSNIPNEVEHMMKAANESVDSSFESNDQREAYHLGVRNTLSALKQLLDEGIRSDSITFYYPDTFTCEEMSAEEIVEWLEALEY